MTDSGTTGDDQSTGPHDCGTVKELVITADELREASGNSRAGEYITQKMTAAGCGPDDHATLEETADGNLRITWRSERKGAGDGP